MMLIALDKMCNQKKFLIQLKQIGKGYEKHVNTLISKSNVKIKKFVPVQQKNEKKKKALLQGNNTSQRDPGSKEEESSKKILQINVISIDRKVIFKKEMFETKQRKKAIHQISLQMVEDISDLESVLSLDNHPLTPSSP